jgi:hypothetical protein
MSKMISNRGIFEVSCKVLGLICLIWGIASLSPVLFIVNRNAIAYLIPTPVCRIASGLILLKWASNIAHFLIHEDAPVELEESKDWSKSLYKLSLRIVGSVALIRAIPGIVGMFLQIIFRSRFSDVDTTSTWLGLVWNIVYFALGVYFVGGAKELVRIAIKGSMRE